MKIQNVLNQADTIHAGMDIKEAVRVYSIYYGLTLQYCEEVIFMGNNNKYYSLQPQAVLIELTDKEIEEKLSKLPKCQQPSCDGYIIISKDKNLGEIKICNKCGK